MTHGQLMKNVLYMYNESFSSNNNNNTSNTNTALVEMLTLE